MKKLLNLIIFTVLFEVQSYVVFHLLDILDNLYMTVFLYGLITIASTIGTYYISTNYLDF